MEAAVALAQEFKIHGTGKGAGRRGGFMGCPHDVGLVQGGACL